MIWNPYFIGPDDKAHLMKKVAMDNGIFLVLAACGINGKVESLNWGDPELPDENECEECSDVYIALFKKAWGSESDEAKEEKKEKDGYHPCGVCISLGRCICK